MRPSECFFTGDPSHAEQLADIHPDWARLVESVPPGASSPPRNVEPFEALAQAVASQHLDRRHSERCVERLVARFPDTRFPTARDLLSLEVGDLEAFGFSREKSMNLHAIGRAAVSGRIPSLREAVTLSDDDLVARIAGIGGVGRWTADMFLIESLGRPDVLPAEDFGVCQGYRNLKDLALPPTPDQMRAIAARWSPLRTTAAWYLRRCKPDFRDRSGLATTIFAAPRPARQAARTARSIRSVATA